jgi:hypothetical protein
VESTGQRINADNVIVVGRTHNGTNDDLWLRKYAP